MANLSPFKINTSLLLTSIILLIPALLGVTGRTSACTPGYFMTASGNCRQSRFWGFPVLQIQLGGTGNARPPLCSSGDCSTASNAEIGKPYNCTGIEDKEYCLNGGKCQVENYKRASYIYCICAGDFHGDRCEIKYAYNYAEAGGYDFDNGVNDYEQSAQFAVGGICPDGYYQSFSGKCIKREELWN